MEPPSGSVPPAGQDALREQLVDLIFRLVVKRGPGAAVEVQRRAASGEGLEVKGVRCDPGVLREALDRYKASAPAAVAASGASLSATVPGVKRAAPSPARAGGLRFNAPAASASALASKALGECETAEPFCRVVSNIGENRVAVLPKPNVLCSPTGEYVQPGQDVDVVARAVSQKDGRVYLRLKKLSGWVSTRSRRDFSRLVFAATDQDGPPVEPQKSGIARASRAMALLRQVDADGRDAGVMPTGVTPAEISSAGGASDVAEPRKPLTFRATFRCQVLHSPALAGAAVAGGLLKVREEFAADAVCYNVAEGRAYLRIHGRGWVCERRRHDFQRFAAEPADRTLLGGDVSEADDQDDGGACEPTVLERARLGLGVDRKVLVVERSADEDASAACGSTDARFAETGGGSPAAARPAGGAVYRSDCELWPRSLGKPSPIDSALRARLRFLYSFYGVRVRECEEDLRDATARADSFSRACEASKAMQAVADAVQKEATTVQDEWAKAVQAALAEFGVNHTSAAAELEAGCDDVGGAVAPVQVRGVRWYCARVAARKASGSAEEASIGEKHLGPLRRLAAVAVADLHSMATAVGRAGGAEEGPDGKRRRLACQPDP